MRHSHKVQFKHVSDVYCICQMTLASPNESKITISSEIDDACWMPLKEFRQKNRHPMLERAMQMVAEGKGLREDEMESTLPGKPTFRLYSY